MHGLRTFAQTYRTPVWLGVVFVLLLAVFAVTPDPSKANGHASVQPTSEPTPGPQECVICSIAQTCDPKTGQCMFEDSTPLPCVQSAQYDSKAGFCLPSGAPPAPAAQPSPGLNQIPGPVFPPGITNPRKPRSGTNFFP